MRTDISWPSLAFATSRAAAHQEIALDRLTLRTRCRTGSTSPARTAALTVFIRLQHGADDLLHSHDVT